MCRINSAVDEADGHPRTRGGIFTLEQVDVGVSPTCTDTLQTPLVSEGGLQAVILSKLLCRDIEIS